MTKLLRKWAQHEPERCSFDGDTCRLAWRLDEPGDTTKAEMNNAMTLAATIEAIEARGGSWELRGSGCPASARVTLNGAAHGCIADEPTDPPAFPLLAAYLAALDAEASQ